MRVGFRLGSALACAAWLALAAGPARAAGPTITLSPAQTFTTSQSAAWVTFTSSSAAQASIEYHATNGPSQSVAEMDFGTEHALLLTGLVPGLTYQGTITATGQAGGTATEPLGPFAATALDQDIGFDVSPEPLIVAPDQAIIAFTTSTSSTARVDYGLKGALDHSVQDAAPSTTHALTLMGLTAGATYTYDVTAVGPDGSIRTTNPTSFTVSPPARDFLPGDVNGDGVVDLADVATALRYYVGALPLAPIQVAAADLNGDGAVNLKDVIAILKAVMAF